MSNFWMRMGKKRAANDGVISKRVVRLLNTDEPDLEDDAQREWYTVFILRGVRYVPHYCNPSYFVSPGFPTHNQRLYTAAELVAYGAIPTKSYLLVRMNTKELHELTEYNPMRIR